MCGKKFIPNSNVQIYCSEQCRIIGTKKYNQQYHKKYYIKKPFKIKVCKRCGKKYQPTGGGQKYCNECNIIICREKDKRWYAKNKELKKQKVKQWGKTHPEKLRENRKRHSAKRERSLGFIPLNKYFEDSVFHHLDFNYGIYIPEEEHKSIWHSVTKNINMDEINAVAFNYI